jgi:hypothetical protein
MQKQGGILTQAHEKILKLRDEIVMPDKPWAAGSLVQDPSAEKPIILFLLEGNGGSVAEMSTAEAVKLVGEILDGLKQVADHMGGKAK